MENSLHLARAEQGSVPACLHLLQQHAHSLFFSSPQAEHRTDSCSCCLGLRSAWSSWGYGLHQDFACSSSVRNRLPPHPGFH
jgi:hypothetical protein